MDMRGWWAGEGEWKWKIMDQSQADAFRLGRTAMEAANGTLVTENSVSISVILLARAFLRVELRFLST